MLLVIAVLLLACGVHASPTAVLLSDAAVILFRADLTAVRLRHPNVPSLQCQGAYCGGALPSQMACKNMGLDDRKQLKWRCESTALASGLSLDSTTVQCEGFSGPNDKYVTAGSCSLLYTLRKDSPPARNWPEPPRVEAQAGSQEYGPEVVVLALAAALIILLLVIFLVARHSDPRHQFYAQPAGYYAPPGYYAPVDVLPIYRAVPRHCHSSSSSSSHDDGGGSSVSFAGTSTI